MTHDHMHAQDLPIVVQDRYIHLAIAQRNFVRIYDEVFDSIERVGVAAVRSYGAKDSASSYGVQSSFVKNK